MRGRSVRLECFAPRTQRKVSNISPTKRSPTTSLMPAIPFYSTTKKANVCIFKCQMTLQTYLDK